MDTNIINKCWVVPISFIVYHVYYIVVITHVYFGGSRKCLRENICLPDKWDYAPRHSKHVHVWHIVESFQYVSRVVYINKG